MTRSMRMRRTGRQLRQELKAALRLSPLALVALLLAVALWQADSAAISGLFQSSPVETPSVTPTVPGVVETPTVPSVVETPTVPGVVETPTAPPTGEITPTSEATLPVPTETLTVIPTETVTVEATQTPVPTETVTAEPPTASAEPSASVEAEATPGDRERYPEGESNLKFDWGMLFDSVSLFLSYAWLCCGVLVFLAVPVVFIVLWVASRRRQQQEE